MLVTCCAIPVLVLLSFLWFAKILLSVELPVSYSGIHHGLKDRLFRKNGESPSKGLPQVGCAEILRTSPRQQGN